MRFSLFHFLLIVNMTQKVNNILKFLIDNDYHQQYNNYCVNDIEIRYQLVGVDKGDHHGKKSAT
jgi:hypothetical protein